MAADRRQIILVVIFFVLAAFLISRVLVIRPRFMHQQGVGELKSGNYDAAIVFFERAETLIPAFFNTLCLTAADRFYRDTYHGRAVYHAAVRDWQDNGLTHRIHDRLIAAESLLQNALALESRDYGTNYWLARTEHALERIHPWLFPGSSNPHNAHVRYDTASALRPAGITVRQAHARYLHEKNMSDRIPELVQNMMEIYPPAYAGVKKEPYFTDDLIPSMEQGLKNAVQKRVQPRRTLQILSRLYQEQDNLTEAVACYQQFLAHDPESNTPGDYMGLGRLYLHDSRYEKGYAAFFQALDRTPDPGSVLRRVYGYFKAEKRYMPFLAFADHIQEQGMNIPGLDMVVVRCCLDMGSTSAAKEKLLRIVADAPTGQAWYLLAQIAKKEKDWDRMEVAAQKATRLDPYSHNFHHLFARALNTRGKYANAESAITQAIRHYPGESHQYYNFRAWTRWHQKKYAEAAQDWDKAAALKPDHPDFPQRAAQAREKLKLKLKLRSDPI